MDLRIYTNFIYDQKFNELIHNNILTNDEWYQWMIQNNFWSPQEQGKLEMFQKGLDKGKLALYEAVEHIRGKTEVNKCRNNLALIKFNIEKLENKRNKFSHLSAESNAMIVRTKYLVGHCLYKQSGKKVWNDEDFIEDNSGLLNKAISIYYNSFLTESQYREIAKTEPWRSMWCSGKDNIFGIPTVEWDDEQQHMIMWSRMYDHIYEHPECPKDDIVMDDDMIDGWILSQRQKKENQRRDNQSNNLANQKAGEIFIPIKDKEDLETIRNLNSPLAEAQKTAKLKAAAQAGEYGIMESNIPEVKQEIMRELKNAKKI